MRDIGLIESALVRPQQLFFYEGEEDALTLAVRLGVGLARNHGFLDGNKRTGAAAMIGRWFEAVIEGRMSEAELADAVHPFITASEG